MIRFLVCARTYICYYSVQGVDQDKMEGRGRGGGQTDLSEKEATISLYSHALAYKRWDLRYR